MYLDTGCGRKLVKANHRTDEADTVCRAGSVYWESFNHIQFTKEITINGVFSSYFFLMHGFVYMVIFLSIKMVLKYIYCFLSCTFHIEVYC